MSQLTCGSLSFPAFSGKDRYKNKQQFQCVRGNGPIPAGRYYILQRQSGGTLGWLREIWSGNDKKDWFALYAADGKVDDEMFCDQVKREAFRLHPKGPLGISEGCITIESQTDFMMISHMLRNSVQEKIPGTEVLAYGQVIVSA